MPAVPPAAPARRRLTWARPCLALLGAVALMGLWGTAYARLRTMDDGLFQASRSGVSALTYYLRGHYAEAARAYRAGLRDEDPPGYEVDLSGYLALRAGQLDLAERRARTTLGLVPGAVEPLVTLGEVALERGDTAAARGHLRTALARRPDHVDAIYLAAVAAARAGAHDEAVERFNRGLRAGSAGDRDTLLVHVLALAGELSAGSDRPLCVLAHVHRYLRIFDERHGLVAMDYARRAVAAGDRPADAWLTLGVIHDKRGEHEAADRAFRQAVAADPRHAEALRWLAMEAQQRGDIVAEHRLLTAAFRSAPTDPYYLDPLEDLVLRRLGDAHGMAALMRQSLARDAGNAAAHEGLARALTALGDRAGARAAWERAVALGRRAPGAGE